LTDHTTRDTHSLSQLLEQLLGRQLGRIRQRFLIHGTGSFLAVLALAVVAYYPLDRYLRLPGGVRVLLSTGIAVYLFYVLRRYVFYPLNRSLTRRDVALAIEERFPELRQKLISAVQLGKSAAETEASIGPRNQSRAMISELIHDAARHADRIPHRQLLDPTRTAKVWTMAAALAVLVVGFAMANPGVASIFVQRVFGMSTTYPRDTYLVIEQPAPAAVGSSETRDGAGATPEFRVTRSNGVIQVTLAAGGDLPVLVRADGIIPREVDLHVEGGRGLPPTIAMSARSEKHFKYTFRRVSEGFHFYPTGGDDTDGRSRVEVFVLNPPRVEMVRSSIEYPAYTRRQPPPVQEGGSIEALIGSRVQFDVKATQDVVSAKIRMLESGLDIELQPIAAQGDGNGRPSYRGSILITRSDRYQVSLVGKEGLKNPHPGTYHIVATPDHPPVGKILTPLDDGLNVTLPDGIVPVRLLSRDDYGLTNITLTMQARENEDATVLSLFAATPDGDPVKRHVGLVFLDLALPEYRSRATVGQSILLTAALTDNREPEAMVTSVGPRQVRVIGETDLLRRVSAHFRRIREDVEQNLKLLLDRTERLTDILDELDAGAALEKQQLSIAYVEVAQGRIRTAASRIHLELMRAFNFHLFNRMETSAHAVTVLELYKTFHEAATEPQSFFPAFYRDLSARRADGRLGAMDKALDPILAMTRGADHIAATLAPESLRLLSLARVAESNKDAASSLTTASTQQRHMIQEFQALLARLDRWNEFQDVITNARSLLDQQRDVRNRTKNLQGGENK
jgi:hypothetical protein